MSNEVFLTRRQLVNRLGDLGFPCSVSTLETYATRGGGPRFYKVGRRVLYREADVRRWIEGRTQGPFSSTSAKTERV